jgi:phosphate butyryltransferase
MALKELTSLVEIAGKKPAKRLIIAAAEDEQVFTAAMKARDQGMVTPIFVGDREKIEALAEGLGTGSPKLEIIDCKEKANSCEIACQHISEGKADILMKGLVNSDLFLKSLLNKKYGLVKDSIISHLAIFETPFYGKLLGITDAAMNISPGLRDKAGIIGNAVRAFHKLGVACPKVAVLAATEKVNPKIRATVHASKLRMMNTRKKIGNCIIEGPLALDNAISKAAAIHKGIENEVAGDADILLVPDLNSGNILYKSLNFLGGAVSAAIVLGASVPAVLTSRSDSDQCKFMSIVFAVAIN